MPYGAMKSWLEGELQEIRDSGLYKDEQVILTPQEPRVRTRDGEVLNFCANNYLGLAHHPEIVAAAREGLESHGFGMASVRFICGTQDIHQELEAALSGFLGTEDTILYTSCFDANAGLFETLLGPQDAILSDALNHASIIDGIRLCRARKKVFGHSDMEDLERKLKETRDCRFRLIATDGVFSMQGDLGRLAKICDLARTHQALVMVDDSHATGFLGPTGRGTAEELGVMDRVDIVTGTLGKALGGASGGFTSGRKEIIRYLRQRSRPYLFSNTVAPPIVAAALKALELIQQDDSLRRTLHQNTRYFRTGLTRLGFEVIEGSHPIVPIMIRDEVRTVQMARAVNARGIFVVGFSFPVVPRGEARIRVQLSAAHTRQDLDRALSAFREAGQETGLLEY
jgi:glycine C-acetyltransferase